MLLAIALAAIGIKVFEDVLGRDSGPFDDALLDFVQAHIPGARRGFFAAVALTGSFQFLFPVVALTALLLVLARRQLDAMLVALSPIVASILVVFIKIVVGRGRPVQGAEAYWDSSFPSGHTVSVVAFATAGALVSIRIWPKSQGVVSAMAVAWILLVALSRLALGVHWPTDVLAAACLGAAIPLLLSLWVSTRRGP